jgi:hypothetical protein
MFRYYSTHTEKNRVSIVGTHEDGTLKISVARTGKGDRFNRKEGRKIAEERLLSGKYFKVLPMKSCDSSTFCKLADEIIDEVHYVTDYNYGTTKKLADELITE